MEYLQELQERVAPMQDELIENLRKLVAFDSVEASALPGMPFGKTVNDALEFVLQLARDMGFEATNLEGYVGLIEWGEGEEMIGILSHVDIVPTGDPADWESPALELTERGGYVYGRGTADDKGPLLSVLYGMKAMKDMGFTPKKRLRVIIGTNEETGWGCMKYYTTHCEIPTASFSPDGMFAAVNREKGIAGLVLEKLIDAPGVSINGGAARNVVPSSCTITLESADTKQVEASVAALPKIPERSYTVSDIGGNVSVACRGKSAPAHTPQGGVNAILGTLEFTANSGLCPLGIAKEAKTLLRLMGDTPDGAAMGLACSDEQSGPMTMNLGVLSLEEGKLNLQLDFRTPVTASLTDIAAKVEEAFRNEGYTRLSLDIKEPLYVPDDLPLIQSLCRVYEGVAGEKAELLSIGGGTYARAFDNCVCFGACYAGEQLNIHMANERALIKNIMQNTVMYGAVVRELTETN